MHAISKFFGIKNGILEKQIYLVLNNIVFSTQNF